jgi:hypothetical protein
MIASGAGWYDRNSLRLYPFDDLASCRDDAGLTPPLGLICDLRIVFPGHVGTFLTLSALTVAPRLITAVFSASDLSVTESGTPILTPVAALSLAGSVVPFRPYPIEALVPGAGGWVVFGAAADASRVPYAGRFTQLSQGAILPRCAAAYRPLPIPYLRKRGVSSALSGVVTLAAGTDIEVISDTRVIEGQSVPALIVRLAGNGLHNLLASYAGPCGGRPESGTCLSPPITAINEVKPDCDGDLRIEFKGVQVDPLTAGGGLAISLPLGMGTACSPSRITTLEPLDGCAAKDPEPVPEPPVVIPVGTPLPPRPTPTPSPTPTVTPPPPPTPMRYVYEINDSLVNPKLTQPAPTGTSWDYGSLNPSPRGPTWKVDGAAPVIGSVSGDPCEPPEGVTSPNISVPIKYELACHNGRPRLYITYPVCGDGHTPTKHKADGTLWDRNAFFLANPASTPRLRTIYADANASCNILDPSGWTFRMVDQALYGGQRAIVVYRTSG